MQETKRLSVFDPEVFNKWRALYQELTDKEQKDFANDCEERYPIQTHHTRSNFDFLFKEVLKKDSSVFEIGGWKGELAKHCIDRYSVTSWMNMELCLNAVAKTVYGLPIKYLIYNPNSFRWWLETKVPKDIFDVCISSHCIEHFSNEDLTLIIEHIAGIPTVMFEAPIKEDGDDWHNYGGTHMLTMGWRGVNKAMVAHGYIPKLINEHCYLYKL